MNRLVLVVGIAAIVLIGILVFVDYSGRAVGDIKRHPACENCRVSDGERTILDK